MILFASDLDNTLIGDDDSLKHFSDLIHKIRDDGFPLKLVYATGRSFDMYEELEGQFSMPKPDALILSIGTEIFIDGSLDSRWQSRVGRLDLNNLKKLCNSIGGLELQPKEDQRDYKLSYFCHSNKVYKDIMQKVKDMPVDVLFSHDLYLDFLPKDINKGTAVSYLASRWGANQIICAGDSGNDTDMLRVGQAIIVANAKPELINALNAFTNEYYVAKRSIAAGVVEGLRHYLKN